MSVAAVAPYRAEDDFVISPRQQAVINTLLSRPLDHPITHREYVYVTVRLLREAR